MKTKALEGHLDWWNRYPGGQWWEDAAAKAFHDRQYRVIERTPGEVYLARFWLSKMKGDDFDKSAESVLLHWILEPDMDQARHDHPWNFTTEILEGWYDEEVGDRCVRRMRTGDRAQHWRPYQHRITQVSPGGVWTLVTTETWDGDWSFYPGGVKVPHTIYQAERGDHGTQGSAPHDHAILSESASD